MSTPELAPKAGYQMYGDLDPFENLVGPFWFDSHTRKAAWTVTARNCNSMSITHGGAVMSFVDFAVFVIAGQVWRDAAADSPLHTTAPEL